MERLTVAFLMLLLLFFINSDRGDMVRGNMVVGDMDRGDLVKGDRDMSNRMVNISGDRLDSARVFSPFQITNFPNTACVGATSRLVDSCSWIVPEIMETLEQVICLQSGLSTVSLQTEIDCLSNIKIDTSHFTLIC